MKRFMTLLFLGLACLQGMQAQGIEFLDNKPVAEALAKADSEGKMVFVDCYTSWCGPCKKLARDVFPLKEVGDFFNPRFVSLKLDMEKGEGPEYAKKWDISAYPTLTFLNSKGEVLFQTLGARDGVQLVDTVAYLLEHNSPSEVAIRYKAGERSPRLVADYIAELNGLHKNNTIETVAGEFVASHHDLLLTDSLAQNILSHHVTDPHNSGFLYAYKHREELPKKMVEDMEFTWRLYTKNYYRMSQGSLGIDEDGMKAYRDFMVANGVENARDYYFYYLLPASFQMKDKRLIFESLEGCLTIGRVVKGQIDMAFRALDTLELTEAEQLRCNELKELYNNHQYKE